MIASSPRPEDLDALRAAPEHHRVLLENDHVRTLETEVGPGDRTAVHVHQWPAVHYVVHWSDFVRRDADEVVLLDTRAGGASAPPSAFWGEPVPAHSIENVGAATLRVISVEMKPLPSP